MKYNEVLPTFIISRHISGLNPNYSGVFFALPNYPGLISLTYLARPNQSELFRLSNLTQLIDPNLINLS